MAQLLGWLGLAVVFTLTSALPSDVAQLDSHDSSEVPLGLSLQLHSGTLCVAVRGSRVEAHQCDTLSRMQRFRYDPHEGTLVNLLTGNCLRGNSVVGESVTTVPCTGAPEEKWEPLGATSKALQVAGGKLCASFDAPGALERCEAGCSEGGAPFDLVLARACVRACLGGTAPRAMPLHMTACSASDANHWRLGSFQPVDCTLGAWGTAQGSTCTTTCGGGTILQHRALIAPALNGGHCEANTRKAPCNSQPCAAESSKGPAVDCQVSDWTPWGACMGVCGAGLQQRSRAAVTIGRNGGLPCTQPLIQARDCKVEGCDHRATDCLVSDWSPWTKCSDECGGGWQSQTRYIDLLPSLDGKLCPTPLQRGRECNTGRCGVDCELGAWSSWSGCDKACDGNQTRTRPVLVEPAHGGSACDEQHSTRACQLNCQQEAHKSQELGEQVDAANQALARALAAANNMDVQSKKDARAVRTQQRAYFQIQTKATAAQRQLDSGQEVSEHAHHKPHKPMAAHSHFDLDDKTHVAVRVSVQHDPSVHGAAAVASALAAQAKSSGSQLEAKEQQAADSSAKLKASLEGVEQARQALEVAVEARDLAGLPRD
eukprot:TRINITY_DN11464_c0_g1_i7.p1 TRINITY_DN11464_c0_g1~~TRINITY_DN11464_c0_g1_i7.p1  ORF type:complete len:599 (-),score=92.31 TRINITY_DN11464_c0_g1_i7:339-2135(-)